MSIGRIGLLPQVATAHFVSHLHIMVLAALFPVLPHFWRGLCGTGLGPQHL